MLMICEERTSLAENSWYIGPGVGACPASSPSSKETCFPGAQQPGDGGWGTEPWQGFYFVNE